MIRHGATDRDPPFLLLLFYTVPIVAAAFLVECACAGETVLLPGGDTPVSGREQPGLAPLDELMLDFMAEHAVPGGALAVARDGRLVYARGFGYADLANRRSVEPASLFRIASLSKPITAVAVLQLVEDGLLGLEEPVFDVLDIEPFLEGGSQVDPRLRRVTIRQLLQHTGGWARDGGYGPMGKVDHIAGVLGIPSPCHPAEIVRFMFGRPLDFAPGRRYAYSNFGYCVLGRVIEEKSNLTYEAHVRKRILSPLGIRDMVIGNSETPCPGEVVYYQRTRPEEGAGGSFLPARKCYVEVFEAHGGWVGSAVDMVRFAAALDKAARCRLLNASSIETMFARPAGLAGYDSEGAPKAAFYGCGWSVRPRGDGRNTWHTGALSGTSTLLVRRHDGLNWAVLFNVRDGRDGAGLATAIDPLVHRAVDRVADWPEDDLFPVFQMEPCLGPGTQSTHREGIEGSAASR